MFAFGVVVAELITGHRALIRDNRETNKLKSLISIVSHFQLNEVHKEGHRDPVKLFNILLYSLEL